MSEGVPKNRNAFFSSMIELGRDARLRCRRVPAVVAILLLIIATAAFAELAPLIAPETLLPTGPLIEESTGPGESPPEPSWSLQGGALQEIQSSPEIIIDDHFLNTGQTDMEKTTATVITDPPGIVTMQEPGPPAALRPDRKQAAVIADGKVKFYGFTGYEMRQYAEMDGAGILSLAYTSGGRFLLALTKDAVKGYGFDQGGGPRLIGSVPDGKGAVILEKGPGDGFLLLFRDQFKFFGWDGAGWVEKGAVAGLFNATHISYCPEDNAVAVVDSGGLKYFLWDGSIFRLVASADVGKVSGIAAEPGGVRLLTDSGTIYYGAAGGRLWRFPGLDDPSAGRFMLKARGLHDFALVSQDGLRYMGFTGHSFRYVEGESITGNFGVAPEPCIYVSKVVSLSEPVSSVSLEVAADVPPGASVIYEVSTDGGRNWTPLTPGEVTQVQEGTQICLRMTLNAQDWAAVPKIDRVTLRRTGEYDVVGAVIPSPLERGRNMEVEVFAVDVQTGEKIEIDRMEIEIPYKTRPDGSPAFYKTEAHRADMTFNPEDKSYHYTYLIPEKTADGYWPDDGDYYVRVIGYKRDESKEKLLPVTIKGHILRRIIIRTMNW